ncbi:hypothetical protein [Psychrobium sp. 1_MG-2023]|uniref:hypothetical protein n=1 Tax=Psychrobium sp. 1_MG-2023 TaxID=3062624 RepID=UPI000C31E6CF|nr:hypothetical protein [Psychrobium sp. 1_MG-2023]MDP2562569.1 hypothetical protein [Psychrobium sp. 1_MG-2023]PKF56786.1 hypothetical protein CW748_08600 [Alteromonadales bacterium alter-6D02]
MIKFKVIVLVLFLFLPSYSEGKDKILLGSCEINIPKHFKQTSNSDFSLIDYIHIRDSGLASILVLREVVSGFRDNLNSKNFSIRKTFYHDGIEVIAYSQLLSKLKQEIKYISLEFDGEQFIAGSINKKEIYEIFRDCLDGQIINSLIKLDMN